MKANTVASRLAVSIVGLGLFAAWQPALAADPGPADLVGALNGVFGVHPGMRAAHTKGFCLTGQFTPAPEAATLSKAPHFAKPVPVTARFSLGGGNRKRPTMKRAMSGAWRSDSTSGAAPSPIS